MWKEAEIWGSKHFDVAWVKVHFKITLLAAVSCIQAGFSYHCVAANHFFSCWYSEGT